MRARQWLISVSGGVLALALLLAVSRPNIFIYYAAIVSGIVFLGSLLERVRYKNIEEGNPGRGWVETEERFIDPETNKHVTVYYNPRTGERRYVAAPHDPFRQPQ